MKIDIYKLIDSGEYEPEMEKPVMPKPIKHPNNSDYLFYEVLQYSKELDSYNEAMRKWLKKSMKYAAQRYKCLEKFKKDALNFCGLAHEFKAEEFHDTAYKDYGKDGLKAVIDEMLNMAEWRK